jgi:hypothetical protein
MTSNIESATVGATKLTSATLAILRFPVGPSRYAWPPELDAMVRIGVKDLITETPSVDNVPVVDVNH